MDQPTPITERANIAAIIDAIDSGIQPYHTDCTDEDITAWYQLPGIGEVLYWYNRRTTAGTYWQW